MYPLLQDLREAFLHAHIKVGPRYLDLMGGLLSPSTSYLTPAMFGMTRVVLSQPHLVAQNLVQNAIDEAKGAARVWKMASTRASGGLAIKMHKHVKDELRHSGQFRGLIPLTGEVATPIERSEEVEAQAAHVMDFDDDLRSFICRVHSIELRSWTVLRIYIDILRQSQYPWALSAIAVLETILADEVTHVLYTGEQISEWLIENAAFESVMSECFSHTDRETWNDMATMASFFASNSDLLHGRSSAQLAAACA